MQKATYIHPQKKKKKTGVHSKNDKRLFKISIISSPAASGTVKDPCGRSRPKLVRRGSMYVHTYLRVLGSLLLLFRLHLPLAAAADVMTGGAASTPQDRPNTVPDSRGAP